MGWPEGVRIVECDGLTRDDAESGARGRRDDTAGRIRGSAAGGVVRGGSANRRDSIGVNLSCRSRSRAGTKHRAPANGRRTIPAR